MNLIINYTKKTDAEFKQLLLDKYNLGNEDYSLVHEEGKSTVAKVLNPDKVDAQIEIKLSKDIMKAYMSIYPPVNNGKDFDISDIHEKIEEYKISVNIKNDTIKNAYSLFSQGGIVENVLIAEGVAPIMGKDAEITLGFDPVDNKPKVREDGTVDYKNIDNIRMVKEGDLLLTKKEPTSGVKGLNVRNEEVPAKEGKDIGITVGEGVKHEEDSNEYFAEQDGCVTFKRNTINVDPIYRVRGNVDYGIGNIDFNGSVHVKQDVMAGFTIKAEKDIYIDGIVQDATLIAGGKVVIKMGIKSEGKALIQANGDVIVGYCENATIKCRGDVEILKYSYNSNIKAGGRLEATKNQGILAGGSYQAYSDILINQAGTHGKSNFLLNVGTKYYNEEEINKLVAAKKKYKENLEKVDEFLSSVDLKKPEIVNNPKVRQLLVLRKQLHGNLSKADEQIDILVKDSHHPKPKIKILHDMHDGLTVQFYNDKLTVREKQQKMVFFYDEKFSRIAMISLSDSEDEYWNE